MASQITDVAIISDPVNVVLQGRFLVRAKARAPYFAGTVPGTVVTHGGSDTAKWRRYENISPTTTALSELSGNVSFPTRDSTVPSITDVTATVARYGQYFVLNEEVDLINPTQQENELADVLAISAGRSLNRLVRNEMEDNATVIRAGGAGSDGAIVQGMTRNLLRLGYNTLDRNAAVPFDAMTTGSTNVGTSPVRESYYLICHSDVAEDIRDLAGFVGVEGYAGQTQTKLGEFGSVGGFRCISTQEAGIRVDSGGAVGSTGLRSDGGSNIDLYDSIAYGENAVGTLSFDMPEHPKEVYMAGDDLPSVMMIRKERGSAGAADPFNDLSTLAWKSWEAEKILNAAFIRRLSSGASDLT